MILSFLFYYIIGIVQDFLLTLNWRYVAKNKAAPAVAFSFATTALSWLVFYNIFSDFDPQKNIMEIIIYSFGVGTGTFLAMKFKIGLRD